MMRRRLLVALLASVFATTAAPHLALAGRRHLEQAIAETKEAIHEGKIGHGVSLIRLANNAIRHARAALEERKSEHIYTAVKHLKKAVETAERGHSLRCMARAVREAETALKHFKAAK